MQCASCRHDNRDVAKFCEECGQPLPASAASSAPDSGPRPSALAVDRARDSTRPPGAYTPKHLAERILTERAALEGERKQVTVLFADVQNSMALAERVGAEEWHKLLDRFFQIMTEGVHRYEGTINQYTGDGIMALFGAPLALEDHAERACHAALHVRE